MHIGEHAERSRAFEAQVRARLVEWGYAVRVARVAAAMLREVMFWEIKAEGRDFWVYRVVKCKTCKPDPDHNCCWYKMGYSKREVHAARDVLVERSLLEYTNGKGLPSGWYNRTHYRVKHLAVMEFLENPPVNDVDHVGQHSWDERSNSVGTNGPTLTESTYRENNISLTESTPDGESFKSKDKKEHDGQHDRFNCATCLRESESLSVGQLVARHVHNRLKSEYRSHGLTPVEFSALIKDANDIYEYGFDDGYGLVIENVYLEELLEAAEIIVNRFEYGDGRAYPPRKPDNLMVRACEAWFHGYELTEI